MSQSNESLRPLGEEAGTDALPMQPLIRDEDGVTRFRANKIVRFLLDANGRIDMNMLAVMDFPREDREQFAQLIGYSVGGFGELSYVSDEAYRAAVARSSSGAPSPEPEQASQANCANRTTPAGGTQSGGELPATFGRFRPKRVVCPVCGGSHAEANLAADCPVEFAHHLLRGAPSPEATAWPMFWCETCQQHQDVTDDPTTDATDAAFAPRDLCCDHCGLVIATYLPPARSSSLLEGSDNGQ